MFQLPEFFTNMWEKFESYVSVKDWGQYGILGSHSFELWIIVKLFSGIPCLAYGTAARFLIRFTETVVTIYFLIKEDYGAQFWSILAH